MKHLLPLLVLTAALSACQKEALRDIDKAEARLEGTWRINGIRLRQTDTLGVTTRDTSFSGGGTVEFRIASDEASDVFNVALFEGGLEGSELVDYFRSKGAGNGTTKGGWSLYWDADPEDRRVQFWGITAGGSYHRGVNLSEGKSSREVFYTLETPGVNTRSFYTWQISK